FTTYHRDMLMSRLLDLLSAGALRAGDKWYDPSLVKTRTQAAKKNKTEDDSGEPPTKKHNTNKGNHDKDNETDTQEPNNSEGKKQKPNKGKSNNKKGKHNTTADSGSNVESNISIGSAEGSERESDGD
ncbi:MAG: hypothetical protein ACKPKO_05795, partial [Candidatus Fonsibacter sp.]